MYYFAHGNNFRDIIKNGIVSRNEILKLGLTKGSDFSNSEVQIRRKYKKIHINGKLTDYKLHDFVPLYWIPKTPTLYAVKELQSILFFIKLNLKEIIQSKKLILFTDGNAASENTLFFDNFSDAKKHISTDVWGAQNWNEFKDGKRKMNAEILIYKNVETDYFDKIIVNNRKLYDYFYKILVEPNVDEMIFKLMQDYSNEYFFLNKILIIILFIII